MCLVWVKAHGGGIAPNAYADAIAKSHLSVEVNVDEVDAPLLARTAGMCGLVGKGPGTRLRPPGKLSSALTPPPTTM